MKRFELMSPIGEGPLGKVYRARDSTSGEAVALRVIEEPDPARAEALVAAARRAAAIEDPRVVSVRAAGIEGSKVWVAMEIVTGRTLRQVLDEEGPFAPARLVEIGCAVCAALEAGHRGDVMHRDLKPSSVMLLGDGGVKVMDFGLAHARDRAGTAPYVSPEAARGWRVDPRSDLYSLGVLLLELATGRAHTDDDGPVAVPSEVPPALTGVLLRMLHKDATARFRSAAAAGDALRRALETSDRSRRAPRRRGAILGASLALAGLVGVVLLTRGRAVTTLLPAFFVGCQLPDPSPK